jgi:hypothetical protein
MEADRRRAPGECDPRRGRRFPRPLGQLHRGGGVLPQADGPCSGLRRGAGGMGVPFADGSAMGIRLPGRDHNGHRLRRPAQQQAGEFQRETLQRSRRRALLEPGRRGRPLPAQPVGPARYARQHF